MEAMRAWRQDDGTWRVEKDGEYLPDVFSSWDEVRKWWKEKRGQGEYTDYFLLNN